MHARLTHAATYAITGVLMLMPRPVESAPRSTGGLHTPERLANIQPNVERFPWARAASKNAIRRAKQWLSIQDSTPEQACELLRLTLT